VAVITVGTRSCCPPRGPCSPASGSAGRSGREPAVDARWGISVIPGRVTAVCAPRPWPCEDPSASPLTPATPGNRVACPAAASRTSTPSTPAPLSSSLAPRMSSPGSAIASWSSRLWC